MEKYVFLFAVSSSANSLLTNPSNHHNNWVEIQASTLAYYYFGKSEKVKSENTIINSNAKQQNLEFLYNFFKSSRL